MQLYCDFDGTISLEDVTDLVLEHLADAQWLELEAQWKAGEIGSRECMQRQIALIRASRRELDELLDQARIDPHFAEFAAFCERSGIDVTIVSDGVDYFIARMLARAGLQHLPIMANHLEMTPQGYQLHAPFARQNCRSAAGVCKCEIVSRGSQPRIFVGDGRSDFCVSILPEIVFAKGKLAQHCASQAIPFIAYRQFDEVQTALARLIAVPARAMEFIPA